MRFSLAMSAYQPVWAARYLAMNGKRRLVGSFWHGSMANAMAQAVGAQKAFPGRQVVSLSGDGGLTMLMGDLLSLSQLKLPVKVVVFNNGTLGFVELEQKSTGLLDFGTELKNPDFAAMAESIGIHGIRLEDPAEVYEGIASAFADDGPVLIDAVVNRSELPMPPSITIEMAKGFSLFMVKAIMNGRVDEIIDLAKNKSLALAGALRMEFRRFSCRCSSRTVSRSTPSSRLSPRHWRRCGRWPPPHFLRETRLSSLAAEEECSMGEEPR